MKKLKLFFRFIKFLIICSLVIVLVYCSFFISHYLTDRNHGNVNLINCTEFEESASYLPNPNRGFYYMYGFMISDEEELDYNDFVPQKLSTGHDMQLALVTFNLQQYNNRNISDKGLRDIEAIFEALRKTEKQFLIRFLYDWYGDNLEYEPHDVNIILSHMKQLEPIFQEYKDIIFVHQGLFIGNWGEMNGTIHLEHIPELSSTLYDVTDGSIFLAVRMPAQWRTATGFTNPDKSTWPIESLSVKLSLYNDGMMGSYSDYGTYGLAGRQESGDFGPWNRTEELIFQQELCKYVPNGGEVIVDNRYNDFNNALNNLKTMHITYLNQDYDQKVLNKWAKEIIADGSVYQGMDGLTYIERHLGYRILINSAAIDYHNLQDDIELNISFQNVGFAPIYKDTETFVVVHNTNTQESHYYPMEADYKELTGGNDSDKKMILNHKISLEGYEPGTYDIYIGIRDVDTKQMIYLANTQELTDYGYLLGEIVVEPIKNPFNQKDFQIDNRMKELLIEIYSKE